MKQKIEVHGHRGERGHFPENSLTGFIAATKKGVDALEMDVIISKDNKVVVSHEPFMSSLYVLTPEGKPIPKAKEKSYNLYEMTYAEIKKFDTGSNGNPRFPQQQKVKTYKPLLSEVIDCIETFTTSEKISPQKYTIEIKSEASAYTIFQPSPEEMIHLVMQIIKEKAIQDRVILQSFDPLLLNILHKNHPEIKISYLVESAGLQQNLSLLNFKPQVYSPNYRLIEDENFVKTIHNLGMQLIPWTVNKEKAIQQMIDFGVDGIISDYPERVLNKR